MTAVEFLDITLDPGLAWCATVPGWNVPSDDRARVETLTIAGQESAFVHRVQLGDGPAHGFWQFERAGGVQGVLNNPQTTSLALAACKAAGVYPALPTPVWTRLGTPHGDELAVAFARLLLWSDPHILPAVGDEQGAWNCYVRNWRPGAVAAGGDRAIEARERWTPNYQAALAAVKERP